MTLIRVRGAYTTKIEAYATVEGEIDMADLLDDAGAAAYEMAEKQADEGLNWDYENGDAGPAQWCGIDGVEVWDDEFGDWIPVTDWLDDHYGEEDE